MTPTRPRPTVWPLADPKAAGGAPARSPHALGVMAFASVVVHAAAVLGIGWLALRSMDDGPAPRSLVTPRAVQTLRAFELPVAAEGILIVDREPDRTGDPVHPAGGDTVARIDTGAGGAGGDVAVSVPA